MDTTTHALLALQAAQLEDSRDAEILLLWDEGQLWSLLALRGLAALVSPERVRVARAQAIAQEGLAGKTRLVLVPGGAARRKSQVLGASGRAALRDLVARGGSYLGFCGGAGLALTWGEEPGTAGLGLCPWGRKRLVNPLQHFVSGHLTTREADHALVPTGDDAMQLPVWWPARFGPPDSGPGEEPDLSLGTARPDGVSVLARYETPADDFWVADLDTSKLPGGALTDLGERYGLSLTPRSLTDQPAVVTGRHGLGAYVLSYAHLETPGSPAANHWFAHLLGSLSGTPVSTSAIPCWELTGGETRTAHPVLSSIIETLETIVELGLTHGLLFPRTAWLLGWRAGIPGGQLNNLLTLAHTARVLTPTDAALAHLDAAKAWAPELLQQFAEAARDYFLAERVAATLAQTSLARTAPAETENGLTKNALRRAKAALFGPLMGAPEASPEASEDTPYQRILNLLDETVALQLGACSPAQPR